MRAAFLLGFLHAWLATDGHNSAQLNAEMRLIAEELFDDQQFSELYQKEYGFYFEHSNVKFLYKLLY